MFIFFSSRYCLCSSLEFVKLLVIPSFFYFYVFFFVSSYYLALILELCYLLLSSFYSLVSSQWYFSYHVLLLTLTFLFSLSEIVITCSTSNFVFWGLTWLLFIYIILFLSTIHLTSIFFIIVYLFVISPCCLIFLQLFLDGLYCVIVILTCLFVISHCALVSFCWNIIIVLPCSGSLVFLSSYHCGARVYALIIRFLLMTSLLNSSHLSYLLFEVWLFLFVNFFTSYCVYLSHSIFIYLLFFLYFQFIIMASVPLFTLFPFCYIWSLCY